MCEEPLLYCLFITLIGREKTIEFDHKDVIDVGEWNMWSCLGLDTDLVNLGLSLYLKSDLINYTWKDHFSLKIRF